MKGPMVTQTLQDIIGHEPLHWRGDRAGIEAFAGAFVSLLALPEAPDAQAMQDLKDFLATLRFEPNPLREIDNSLPASLDHGLLSVGRFSPAGTPLPVGDPQRGLELYLPPNLTSVAFSCAACHTLPTGMSSDRTWEEDGDGGGRWALTERGPNGEFHHWITGRDPVAAPGFKTSQLRSIRDKQGFDTLNNRSMAGFGLLHDGTVSGIVRFISSGPFQLADDQELSDLVAFMLCFTGSDLPEPPTDTDFLYPPGEPSLDTPAAVGRRSALGTTLDLGLESLELSELLALADGSELGIVVHGRVADEPRGFAYLELGTWQPDRAAESLDTDELLTILADDPGATLTVVPGISLFRLSVDRDGDGALDGDERDAGSDPADPLSLP